MLKKGSKEQQLPPNLPKADFKALPNKPGVYYFRNNKGRVIYVGKAKDCNRVGQHFTEQDINPQRQLNHQLRNVTKKLVGCDSNNNLWPDINFNVTIL